MFESLSERLGGVFDRLTKAGALSEADVITALREVGGEIDHVEATDSEGRFQRLRADAYVLAMGSLTPLYAAPLGIQLPIYPAKGYSVTMPVKDASMAHQVSLTDDEYKLVFSRLTGPGGDRRNCWAHGAGTHRHYLFPAGGATERLVLHRHPGGWS